jgi:hypothetical protein
MTISHRMMIIAVAIFGLGLGVAFGAGVAVGHGDPKTAEGGLTAQQIQSLLGINVSQASGANEGAAGNAGGTGGAQRQGASQAAARLTTGSITAVDGQTLTIETRQGSQKVHLAASTVLSRLMPGSAADLKPGMTVLANGTRREDGSLDATDISEVGSAIQALLGGATGAPAGGAPAGGR